jgi:hypothetical protein
MALFVIQALALTLAATASAQEPAPAQGVELPESPAARAFAGVGPATLASALPGPPAQDLNSGAWRNSAPWMAWAAAVHAESEAPHPDATRRAFLAQVALAQERFDDAWDHFAATGGDPKLCAALLPWFLPGVACAPAASPGDAGKAPVFALAAGGRIGALPEGVLLRPALPPPSLPAAEVVLGRKWIERRMMRVSDLHIGEAVVAMQVSLESDGIQVEFTHQSGGSASFSVLLPEPSDFEIRVAYIDWMRQDELGLALEVSIAPGDEPHTLFGRFKPRAIPWPTQLPKQASSALREHGLQLYCPAEFPDAAMIEAAAPAFARVLGLPVVVVHEGGADFPGVRISLDDAALAQRKFLGVVTLAERFALRARR